MVLKLKNFMSINTRNQQNDVLSNNLQNLTLGDCFNQKLENLPNNLQNLTLGYWFNQKLENLPNNLQNLTLGYCFNQSLNPCVALPKLRNLTLNTRYNLKMPPLFNTTIIYISSDNKIYKKIYYNYENYSIDTWKNIFYKSITIN